MTTTPSLPSIRADERGQVMPLAALSLLAVALSIFSVLSMLRSTHEKIRLQNYADAEAYSLAVEEARSYNYYAYSNRAIASTYVQMATLHAYMSLSAMMADSEIAMGIIMFEISAEEFAECCCGPFGAPICIQHCWHSIEAAINGVIYLIDWISNSAGSQVNQIDGKFRTVIKDLNSHAKLLYDSQVQLSGAMAGMLYTGIKSVKNSITNNGGKTSLTDLGTGSLTALMTALNWVHYSDTINNNATAIPPGSYPKGVANDKKEAIMSNVVNATRRPLPGTALAC
jgi:hypothetical protein